MRLAILGATGGVGRVLVTQALEAGHKVTALVRTPPKPGEIDGRVELVVGDATSADDVKGVVHGSDAVLSALGHAKAAPDDVLARVSSDLITAMQADSVRRLVVLSSAAVVDAADRPGVSYRAARVLLRAVMPRVVRDHRNQARLIEASGLAWTIVRGPLVFTDGPRTGLYHAGPIGRRSGFRVSRADLADFMLAIATDGGYMQMKPLVSQ
jgi:putative NADH-flavin reductase